MADPIVAPQPPAPVVLTVDAGDDVVTQAGWNVREQVLYQYITGTLGQLVRCQGPDAVRANAGAAAANPAVKLLMGVSHGTSGTYVGYGPDPLYAVGNYAPAEVAGKVVHWTACETAAQLGPDMVANGAAAFFGYTNDIVFPPELASMLFDCDAEIDIALLGGATAGEAYQRCVARYNDFITECDNQGKSYLAQWLATNRDLLVNLGDAGARIR